MVLENFNIVETTREAIELISHFELPDELQFGAVTSPIMIESDYKNGQWSDLKCVPLRPIELHPTCKVLHYAQEIFEGLKAYNLNDQGPYLFRPELNGERFNQSASRMAMPQLPESYFMKAVEATASYNAHLIPHESGSSLYIRPFMFATENNLGIKPSEEFKFMVLASPSQAYFKSGSVSVLVERNAVRACPGGVGAAKTGGNYAASLKSMIEAKNIGFDQVLWLDATEKKFIEEMSGMNFFAVYDNEIVTPKLTETILDGITRRSIISIANHLGIKVTEKQMVVDELLEDIRQGKCQEAFACGTAVIITPINSLGEVDGHKVDLPLTNGPLTQKLKEFLLGVQEGSLEDPFEWRKKVARAIPK